MRPFPDCSTDRQPGQSAAVVAIESQSAEIGVQGTDRNLGVTPAQAGMTGRMASRPDDPLVDQPRLSPRPRAGVQNGRRRGPCRAPAGSRNKSGMTDGTGRPDAGSRSGMTGGAGRPDAGSRSGMTGGTTGGHRPKERAGPFPQRGGPARFPFAVVRRRAAFTRGRSGRRSSP